MARTNRDTTRLWIVEGLKSLGGSVEFNELVEHLEKVKADHLSVEDHHIQQGHPNDTQFKYMCRWAVTYLRQEGIVRRGSPRGWVEFSDGTDAIVHQELYKKSNNQKENIKEVNYLINSYVGTKPFNWRISLADENIEPRTWRNLLIEVASWIGEDKLINIVQKKRGKWPVIVDNEGPIPSKYADIPGTHLRAYVYANADLTVRHARFILVETGHDPDQLVLEPLNAPDQTLGHTGPSSNFIRRNRPLKKRREISHRDRHRKIFAHLKRFGEITAWEADRTGIRTDDIEKWVDSLAIVRPNSIVATPLFFLLAEDNDPKVFAMRIVSEMMKAQFEVDQIEEEQDDLERYIWSHFGGWHLGQPYAEDKRWHQYLKIPFSESVSTSASEKLDLFAHLPPEIISKLVRDTAFLNEQQTWSAQATNKNLGLLSRQLKSGIKRPLILTKLIFPTNDGGEILLNNIEAVEILKRSYVVSGLPLCSIDQWQENLCMAKEDIVACVLEHPLYAIIVQFEVQRLMAGLSNEYVIKILKETEGKLFLESDNIRKPLWQACRFILEDLGFWAVNDATKDENWINAIDAAIRNLEMLDVLRYQNLDVCLTESFASQIKAHPSHPQNRGEKAFRLYLVKQFENIMKGK